MANPFDQFDTVQANPFDQFDAVTPPPAVPAEQSQFPKRLDNIGKIFTSPTAEEVAGRPTDSINPFLPILASATKVPGRLFDAGGQVAGMVGDAVGGAIMSGIKSIYDASTPDEAKKAFTDAMKSVATSGTGQTAIKGMQEIQKAYGKVKETFPELMGHVEATANYLGVLPFGMAGKAAAGPTIKAAEMLKSAVTPARTIEKLDELTKSAIENGFKIGVKPSVVGKENAGLTQKFYDNATTGTMELVERHPDIALEMAKGDKGTTEKFSQTIRDTKKEVYADYHKMAVDAGSEGAKVSISPLRSDLTAVIEAENVPEASKRAAKRVLNDIKSYADEVSPDIAEDLIAYFNSKTKKLFMDQNWNRADDLVFQERSAGMLRKLTDESIEGYQGPGWQDLRNKYGSLTAIEKPVTDRANVVARKNLKGLFDIADIYTTGEFVSALATANPVQFTKAAAMAMAKKHINNLNDADKNLGKMFKDVTKYTEIRNKLAPSGDPSMTPKVGPFVRSSEVDSQISADMAARRAVEAENNAAAYGRTDLPKTQQAPPKTELQKALTNPDEMDAAMATDAGAIDTRLNISPAEREANMNLAQRVRTVLAESGVPSPQSISDEQILKIAKAQGLDYRLGKQPGQPDKYAPAPSTDVRSGVTVGSPYTPIGKIMADKSLSKEEKNRLLKEYIKRTKR